MRLEKHRKVQLPSQTNAGYGFEQQIHVDLGY